MKIAPYVKYLMQFAMPDAGGQPGGGGGGGSPPAAPAGGKPAAGAPTAPNAPPEPKIEPAEHEPETRTDAQKEIDDFAPPSLDDLGEADPNPPPPKPGEEPKPGDKKDPPPAPKPGDGKNPEDDPKIGAGPLRKELAAVRKERDTLKAAAAKGDPKLPTLTAEIEGLKKTRDDVVKENDDLRARLAFHDPSTSAELTKMDQEFNATFDNKTKLMPKIRGVIGALVGEFRALPTDEKYDAALEEFETKVAGIVGQGRAQSAMQLIQEGAEFFDKRGKIENDLKTNGLKRQSESQQKAFDEGVKTFHEDVKDALAVSDDLKSAHPYHPLAFVNNVIANFDEPAKAKFKEFEASVDRYTAYAAAGLSPKTLEEFSKMDAAERDAAITAFNEKRRTAIKTSRQMIKRAYVYEKLMTGFLKNYAAMEEKLRKLTGGQPPDPNNTPKPGEGGDDIQSFRPPSVAEL